MSEHVLKIHEQPFNDLLSGEKTAEIRNNDRGFQVGDTVQLHEIADSYTGRVMHRQVTHVQTGYGLPDGLCVLSYAPLISTLKAGQGDAVGKIWAMADGKQYASLFTEHMNSQKLVGARLYTTPPAPADAVSIAPGLERAIQIVREVAKAQPGYSDEREAIFEALSEAYVEAKAPQHPPASADAVSVPRELLELEWLEGWLRFAAEPIGQECCGRGGQECCGCPDPVYPCLEDVGLAMDERAKELRALLAQQEVKS